MSGKEASVEQTVVGGGRVALVVVLVLIVELVSVWWVRLQGTADRAGQAGHLTTHDARDELVVRCPTRAGF